MYTFLSPCDIKAQSTYGSLFRVTIIIIFAFTQRLHIQHRVVILKKKKKWTTEIINTNMETHKDIIYIYTRNIDRNDSYCKYTNI